uniref:t-SNARE coiled-coil homology domain-containing protein n=2 Tax=Toxoplasma gondii (strain ATCC 50861 / VEG) TaxID=432359 RepID=A0A0F7UZY8_TOXGV|nr:TPA: hypothetical protein BN1205_109035 [Toxoplasma gondii VEG]
MHASVLGVLRPLPETLASRLRLWNMCDRTPDFQSCCRALQQVSPSLRALCDTPFPAPPFPFFSLAAEADSSPGAPPPACKFVFLERAAQCAAEQSAVERQLRAGHTLANSLGPSTAFKASTVSAACGDSAGPGADVSLLLKKVQRQQLQLQALEKSAESWEDVTNLARRQTEWEESRRKKLRAHPDLKRLLTPARRTSDQPPGASSAATAHRHAILGCLYTQMQDLASTLKQRELAALQGRLDSRRYFSAFATAAVSQASGDPSRRPAAGPQKASRLASHCMRATLAAAEAAKTAERLLFPQMHRSSRGAFPGSVQNGAQGTHDEENAPREARASRLPGSAGLLEEGRRSGGNTNEARETGERGEASETQAREVEMTALRADGWRAQRKGRNGEEKDVTGVLLDTEGECGAAASVDLQLLAREERELVEALSTDADVIQEVHAKLTEIVHCMDVFSAKVLEQSEACEHIRELADAAVENIDGAEKHLTKAVERTSAYRYYVLLFFLVAGWLVLLFDFLKSSSPYI